MSILALKNNFGIIRQVRWRVPTIATSKPNARDSHTALFGAATPCRDAAASPVQFNRCVSFRDVVVVIVVVVVVLVVVVVFAGVVVVAAAVVAAVVVV